MNEQSKINQELIAENSALKQRIQELELSDSERKQAEEAMRESEEKYRLLFENSPLGHLIFDEKGVIVECNTNFVQIIGSSRKALIGLNMLNLPDKKMVSTIQKALNGSIGLYEGVYHSVTAKKATPTRALFAPMISEGGRILGGVGIIEDVTDSTRIAEALRESEKSYRTLVENASDMIYRTDENGYFTFVNPAFSRITGYEAEEIIGNHYKMLIRPDMFKEAITFFANQLINKIPNTFYEYPIIAKDGHEVWIGQNLQLIMKEDHVTGFQAVARDITERKRAEAKLRESEERYRELSIIDDLTQLYNSRHFYHQLKIELDRVARYGQHLSLLLLDLDDFKVFNDTFGHIEGDLVLSRLGQVIKRCLRQTDSAYRYGGEEFTILLPMTTSEDGAVTAERIRTEFKKERFSPVPGKEVHLTVSIGLAQYKTQEDMKAFVHRVDQLMYQGKKNGKDRVCFKS